MFKPGDQVKFCYQWSSTHYIVEAAANRIPRPKSIYEIESVDKYGRIKLVGLSDLWPKFHFELIEPAYVTEFNEEWKKLTSE